MDEIKNKLEKKNNKFNRFELYDNFIEYSHCFKKSMVVIRYVFTNINKLNLTEAIKEMKTEIKEYKKHNGAIHGMTDYLPSIKQGAY